MPWDENDFVSHHLTSDVNSAPLTAQLEPWKANLATLAQRGEIIDTNSIMLVVFGSNNDDNGSAITYIP
jgi:hypothetical protein